MLMTVIMIVMSAKKEKEMKKNEILKLYKTVVNSSHP